MKKKSLLSLFFIALFISSFIFINVVYAATSSKVAFCDYMGVRRTFKILGIVINIVKIAVPIILTITGMVALGKTVVSGKSEDLTSSISLLAKKMIAGFIVFLIPSVLDFTFDSLVGYDDSGFTQCTNCLFDTNNCTIPTSDPDTYSE